MTVTEVYIENGDGKITKLTPPEVLTYFILRST